MTVTGWFSDNNYLGSFLFSILIVFLFVCLFLNTFAETKRALDVRIPFIVNSSCDQMRPRFLDKHRGRRVTIL